MNKGMIRTHDDLIRISITKGGIGCKVGFQPLTHHQELASAGS